MLLIDYNKLDDIEREKIKKYFWDLFVYENDCKMLESIDMILNPEFYIDKNIFKK